MQTRLRPEHGRWALSTGAAALAAIAIVDVIFAVDSVPAILAITSDTFIVFAANAFALLGLRPLFFLVADLVERLYYLKTSLAVLLVFIGAKMAAAEFVGKIGPEYSPARDRRDPRHRRGRLARPQPPRDTSRMRFPGVIPAVTTPFDAERSRRPRRPRSATPDRSSTPV